MIKNKFISKISRRVLPLALAASLAFPYTARGVKEIELPKKYHLVNDNRTGEPVEFEIFYSGEKFNVNMIETDKRGEGKWRPWLIQGRIGRGRNAVSYTVGRDNDDLSRFYGMDEDEFYARLAMVATVAYFDDVIINWPGILRDRAAEFRTTASGNIYLNAGREVFDLSGIAGGILLSKAVLKSNPGAIILAGKKIKSMIMDHFMERSTSPRNPKEFVRAVGNIADFIKSRIITENITRLQGYASSLEECATILDNHDLNPRTVQPGWDYASAKALYERLSVAFPEGEALNSFLRELRGKETQIDALEKRLLEKAFEGVTGVTYGEVINVSESIVEIFHRQPDIKRGLNRATVIARKNKKEFLMHFESRFDITPNRKTDANAFLDARWPEYEEDLPEEIGEEEHIAQDESQEIKGAFPPPKIPRATQESDNLESIIEEQREPRRAQGEPDVIRNVFVSNYEPRTVVAGISGKFYIYVRNDNNFRVESVDILGIDGHAKDAPEKYSGFTIYDDRQVGGWGASLPPPSIDVLEPNEEKAIERKFRASKNTIIGNHKFEYQMIFKLDGVRQTTNRDDIEVEVVEGSK